jgi:DNA-binding CsgD family transcriptional regulator
MAKPEDQKFVAALGRLTVHQCNILRSRAEGLSNGQIAQRSGISAQTIKNHLNIIYRALGIAGNGVANLMKRPRAFYLIGLHDASRGDDSTYIALPTIVCLCGSTRFWREFQAASLRETLDGKIVLSIGAAAASDREHFGHLTLREYNRVKAQLDQLHLRKIDLADEVLILNKDGYIGESTRREMRYAILTGKRLCFLEPDKVDELPDVRNQPSYDPELLNDVSWDVA